MKPTFETTLHIDTCGQMHTVDALNEEFLDALGYRSKRRASHVWPVHRGKQIMFRLIRALVGERGFIAAWCRSWRGPWEVRFIDPLAKGRPGAVVFSHPSRRVCIAWEIKQINERLAHD
jgi:hypothetical protein